MNASRAMSSFVDLGGYAFSGPFKMTKYLHHLPGVFAILDVQADDSWTVVDVGVADDVRTDVEKHEGLPLWNQHRKGELAVAALYSDSQAQRDKEHIVVTEVRSRCRPPCVDRDGCAG